MRALPTTFDPAILAEIDARLDAIRREHAVALPLVIESGSRAWGFPSPDSDYDCRFVFVRRPDDYLTPWPKRDVIETPLTALLDVNGWELGKALKLLLKGNAVILEWLRSPIVYGGDLQFRAGFLALAEEVSDRFRITHHYLHMGEREQRTRLAAGKEIALKRLFYVLRPAMVLRWLRLHEDANVPPMHFPTLAAEANLAAGLKTLIDELLARKAVTNELGTGEAPDIVRMFCADELTRARQTLDNQVPREMPNAYDLAETFFRESVMRLGARIS